MTTTAFSSLPLTPELLANIDSLGYTEMTPIQAQSLPPILDGEDARVEDDPAPVARGQGVDVAAGAVLDAAHRVDDLRRDHVVVDLELVEEKLGR